MIGSPENNFNTMQNQQPSPQRYGDALQRYRQPHPETRDEYMAYKRNRMNEPMYNMGGYNNRMSTAESYNKYGMPTPPMMMQPPTSSSMFAPTAKLSQNNSLLGQSVFNTSLLPQSNASSNLQPQIPSQTGTTQGPPGLQSTGYATGLATPAQNTQVQSGIVNGASSMPTNVVGSNGQVQSSIVTNSAKPKPIAITNAMLKGSLGF